MIETHSDNSILRLKKIFEDSEELDTILSEALKMPGGFVREFLDAFDKISPEFENFNKKDDYIYEL